MSTLRHGGLFKYPPQMYKQIQSWVQDVIQANVYEHLEQKLEELKKHPDEEIFEDIEETAQEVSSSRGSSSPREDLARYQNLGGWVAEFGDENAFPRMPPKKFTDLSADDRHKELTNLVGWFRRKKEEDLKELLKERAEWIADTEKYLAKAERPKDAKPGTQEREFELDLEGWDYFNDAFKSRSRKKLNKQVDKELAEANKDGDLSPSELKETRKTLQKNIVDKALDNIPKVTVSLIDFSKSRQPPPSWKGQWSDKKNTLTLPISRTPDKNWQRTLGHELRHMGQSLMRRALGIPYKEHTEDGRKKNPAGPGVPSRHITNPEIQQGYGNPEETPSGALSLIRRLKEQGIAKPDFHSLDDLEFYTLLADAVDVFTGDQKKKKWDARETQTALRLFSGVLKAPEKKADWDKIDPNGNIRFSNAARPNNAFQTWKKHSPKKWEKATKELVKAVPSSKSAPNQKSLQAFWKQFLDERYDGGKAKVPNPNSKTRDRHPEITVTYLMGQSEPSYGPARQRIRKDFAAWRQQSG